MNTIYLLCVGGSGLRVLRAFTMLLGAGYDIPGYQIKPFIIDPHLQSDDLTLTTGIISKYLEIHNPASKGFFKVKMSIDDLNSLNIISGDNKPNRSFSDFIGYTKLNSGSPEKDIVDVLYTYNNLNKSMDLGFKGSPNVGCIVFQESINSDWLRKNISNLAPEDKVILVGSLFGGTGASGLPAIAQAIKKLSAGINLALIALSPYFQLKRPDPNAENKDIDSDTFDMKSLAALNFYQDNHSFIDSFYLVGDNIKQSNNYEYDEIKQGNKAHFVELIAAMAVKDFAIGKKEKWNMFYTDTLNPVMTYSDCRKCMSEVLKCLSNFYILSKFLFLMREDKFYPVNIRGYRSIKFSSQENAARIGALENFIYNPDHPAEDSFIRWLGELRDNQRSFNAVNTEDIISPTGQISQYRFKPKSPCRIYNGSPILNDKTMSDYFLAISKEFRKAMSSQDQTDPVTGFLNICYSGIKTENSK